MRAFVVTVGVAALMAGCGGSGSDGEPMTASQVAEKAGCTGYEGGETQMYTRESGSCTIDGQDIYVATFADTKARDNWFKVAKEMGASGSFGQGATWVIQGDDRAKVEEATKAAGGELVP